jgi:CheY-specific phosphatase CheX
MEQALYQAAVLTFEELGFIFPVERLPDDEVENYDSVSVSVKFNGIFCGQVVLQVENSILPTLASNMLGDEETFEDEILFDVLGELTNVICGNALPAIAGKQEIFHLEAPQIVLKSDISAAPTAVAFLDVEESKADVLLYIN